jgi:hypothetical protein
MPDIKYVLVLSAIGVLLFLQGIAVQITEILAKNLVGQN